ncbi:Hypothetical protein AA314_07659 [Archangium gephyra]|uniref:Uncharacterized protein n=1 Tax=Archangium gephyra TaxID=48 RepID=A0AAC8QE37_9BACT|nr:Hypothetical protein AA314_07659 [Archangium gephyra]
MVDQARYPYIIYPSSYQLNDNYPWLTDTYPFDPYWVYSPAEQDTIVNDEAAITNAQVLFDWSDGSRILDVDQATIPEANQHNVPPVDESVPSGDALPETATVFMKSYNRTEKFGNKLFGAGYQAKASITATTATTATTKKVDAQAEGRVFATAFSFEKDIVRAHAYITGQQGGANTGRAALYVMGSEVWSTPLNYADETSPLDWNTTFFSVKQHFTVGPVPMSASASMSGGAKFTVKWEISPTVARLTLTPNGNSKVTFSAGVDIFVLYVGVEGTLSIVNVGVPAYGELFWPLCQLAWTLDSKLNIGALSGTVALVAQVKFLFFSQSYKVTIAKWPGLTKSLTLLNRNGAQNLGICGS